MVTVKSKNIETIENELIFKCYCGKKAVGWISCDPLCPEHYEEEKVAQVKYSYHRNK